MPQVEQEQEKPDVLVAAGIGMILDHEIQQVRGLVVFQKQAPGIGVACDQFQNHLPRIVHQGLAVRGPSEQIEGLARFAQAAFGQPALVERIAANQMCGSPIGGSARRACY